MADDSDMTDPRTSVMIVEDEPLVAMDLEDILSSHGYGVLGPAATVEQALALLDEERPDAALLDASLGGREWSTPVAEALRRAQIPYLVMSAFGSDQLKPSGLLDGTQNLGKPVDERRVIEALADLVSASS